jgi:hypothetical protein
MPLTPQSARRKDRTQPSGVPAMQHRHFAFIAGVIRDERYIYPNDREAQELLDGLAQRFANNLRATNPNFDAARFLEACK